MIPEVGTGLEKGGHLGGERFEESSSRTVHDVVAARAIVSIQSAETHVLRATTVTPRVCVVRACIDTRDRVQAKYCIVARHDLMPVVTSCVSPTLASADIDTARSISIT